MKLFVIFVLLPLILVCPAQSHRGNGHKGELRREKQKTHKASSGLTTENPVAMAASEEIIAEGSVRTRKRTHIDNKQDGVPMETEFLMAVSPRPISTKARQNNDKKAIVKMHKPTSPKSEIANKLRRAKSHTNTIQRVKNNKIPSKVGAKKSKGGKSSQRRFPKKFDAQKHGFKKMQRRERQKKQSRVGDKLRKNKKGKKQEKQKMLKNKN